MEEEEGELGGVEGEVVGCLGGVGVAAAVEVCAAAATAAVWAR